MLQYTVLLLAGVFLPAFQADQEQGHLAEPVDVFLLAGQSNMEGVGRVELLREEAMDVPGVQLLHSAALGTPGQDGKWLPLRPSAWRGGSSPKFGVEMSLGAALAGESTRPKIYFIKHAVGGTSLFRDWSPRGGPEYEELRDVARRAFTELEAQGLRPVVRGVFWQQGEEDAKHTRMACAYQQRLEDFIVRLRASLAKYAPERESARIRFVLGQVIPDAAAGSSAAKTYPFRGLVRSAQLAVASYLRNVVTVQTDATFETHASVRDGYRDDDNIHFNESGLAKLGTAMAEAYLTAEEPREGAEGAIVPRALRISWRLAASPLLQHVLRVLQGSAGRACNRVDIRAGAGHHVA